MRQGQATRDSGTLCFSAQLSHKAAPEGFVMAELRHTALCCAGAVRCGVSLPSHSTRRQEQERTSNQPPHTRKDRRHTSSDGRKDLVQLRRLDVDSGKSQRPPWFYVRVNRAGPGLCPVLQKISRIISTGGQRRGWILLTHLHADKRELTPPHTSRSSLSRVRQVVLESQRARPSSPQQHVLAPSPAILLPPTQRCRWDPNAPSQSSTAGKHSHFPAPKSYTLKVTTPGEVSCCMQKNTLQRC